MHFVFHPFRCSFYKNTTSKRLYLFSVCFRHLLTLWRLRTALECSYLHDPRYLNKRCCFIWNSRLRSPVLLRAVIGRKWVWGNGGEKLTGRKGKPVALSQCHFALHRCHMAWPRIELWWLTKRLCRFVSCLTQRCMAPSERSPFCLPTRLRGRLSGAVAKYLPGHCDRIPTTRLFGRSMW